MDDLAGFRWRKRWQALRRVTPNVVIVLLLVVAAAAALVRIDGTRGLPGFAGGKLAVTGVHFTLCGFARDACVIDGDTIRYGGERIRVEDIDAPETHDPKCPYEQTLGARATERLLELVNAGPFDIVRTGGRDRDRYGRKLRRLERNGRSLGGILVDEGLARRWDGRRHPWC